MSHVREQTMDIKDLDCLDRAAQQLGLTFDRLATQFRYYGGAMHKCDGKLAIANNSNAYEVGLAKKDNGTYNLLWDDFAGGRGLVNKVGKDLGILKDEYIAQVAMKQLARMGMRVSRTKAADGATVVVGQ